MAPVFRFSIWATATATFVLRPEGVLAAWALAGRLDVEIGLFHQRNWYTGDEVDGELRLRCS